MTLSYLAHFMLFSYLGKGHLRTMQLKQHKEYQTIRLFAILAAMTVLVVLLFKVVLFAPQTYETSRQPAQNITGSESLHSNGMLKKPTDKR